MSRQTMAKPEQRIEVSSVTSGFGEVLHSLPEGEVKASFCLTEVILIKKTME